MKRTLPAIVAIFLLSLAVCAQDKPLPEYGDISDLKGMSKVYVNADSTEARKYILNRLKEYPSLKVVASPDEAEFFLDCARNGHILTSSTLVPEMDTYEMTVYTINDGRHRIAWSRTKTVSPICTNLAHWRFHWRSQEKP